MNSDTNAIEIAIEQAVQWGEGLILVEHHDTGYTAKLQTLMDSSGQLKRLKIVTFDPFQFSATYNPFAGVSPSIAVARALQFDAESKQEFWTDIARYTLATVQLILALQPRSSGFHIKDVMALLSDLNLQLSCVEQIDASASEAHKLGLNWINSAMSHWKNGNEWDYRQYKMLTIGMLCKLSSLGHGEYSSVLNTYMPEVDLGLAIREKQVVIFCLSGLHNTGSPYLFYHLMMLDLETALAQDSRSASDTTHLQRPNSDRVVRLTPDTTLIQVLQARTHQAPAMGAREATVADQMRMLTA
jgi:intracellular multiplication protein IcmO